MPIDIGTLGRAQGCLLGQLAGDALGSQVEFQSAEAIHRRYPTDLREIGPSAIWHTLAGQPTDDSELALALARSILKGGSYDREAAALAYVEWFRSGPFDIGGTTSQALGAVSSLDVRAGRVAERAEGAARRVSEANGALMRISPLGIWGHATPPDDLAEHARADARITHPHSVCQEANAVFVAALAFAIRSGASAAEVYATTLNWAEAACREPIIVRTLRAASIEPPADFTTHQGWVLVALQNAFFRVLHAPSLEEGVVTTVMAGGDTDTNGAIAGALLGAVHGLATVPNQWRQAVLSCRPLAGLAGVHQPRPEQFWPVDALETAEQLLRSGNAG